MEIDHFLNVYGEDDFLAYSSAPLSPERMKRVKEIVEIDDDDPEAWGSYPLTHEQAQSIIGRARRRCANTAR